MAVSEAELSAGELFTSLGMLIIQGRKWDGFRRSRGRGLHCPTVRNSAPPQHQCSPSNAECEAALSFKNAIQTIWQRGVTMMIDVILLPECGHQETTLLLEKWLLQPTNEDFTMAALSLMQAIDSTIHFSQLCSWWSSTNGCQPRNIRYHVYESENNPDPILRFSEPAINHNFMVSHGVKVRLQYLPRQKTIPEVNCVICAQQMDVGSPNRGRSFNHRGHRRGSRHSSASSDSLSPSVARVDISPYGSPLLSPSLMRSLSSSSSSRASSRTGSPCVSRSPSENSVFMAFEAHRQVEELERKLNEDNSIVSRNDSGFIENSSRDGMTINRDEELANQLDSISDSDLSDDYIIDGPVGSPGLVGTPIASPDDARVQMLQSTFAGWHCRRPTFDRLMSDETGAQNRTRHTSLDSAVSNLERLELRTRRHLSRTSSDGHKFADFRENSKTDSEKDFFIRDIKKRHKISNSEPQECNADTQHCTPDNTFYASFRNDPNHPWQHPCTPFLDVSNSQDDFSTNFNSFQFSQCHMMNSTPTTVGFVTLPRPMSLNLSHDQFENGIPGVIFDPQNSHCASSSNTDNDKESQECPNVNLTPTISKQNHKTSEETKAESSRIDETPNLRPSRSLNLVLRTRPNITSLDIKLEDSDVVGVSSSALLRSPPSKLRILPSHCVDKNFLHNPPRQPIHKVSANSQCGPARRLQFHQTSEKQTCTSPAPIRRNNSVRFEFDEDMPKINQRSSRSICRGKCMKKNGIVVHNHTHATSAHRLLGSFEESIIHNCLEILGSVDGFNAQLGASGSFCPAKVKLSVPVRFFHVSDDNAPSPYMGTMSLKGRECGKRGYHIPRKGTIQLTLFNPNNSVVKVFVILYDVSDMPPGHRTFLRHRIYSKPTAVSGTVDHNGNLVKPDSKNSTLDKTKKTECLRYFVNLWLESSKTNKVYIHGDVKILFSLASNEWDSGNTFVLHTETEFPKNPKYSSKR